MADRTELKYSVLMSVYDREKPEFLRTAMDSMWNQTAAPDEFVLVCDGPLNDSLDAVIADMEKKHPELKVIRLEENGGLGNALNIGLKACRNELVARMDSDDISRPDRCERQLAVFRERPDISVCSGTVEEITDSEGTIRVESSRVLPETPEEIRKFARNRSPFNHPCVMFRKRDVEAAGGYHSSLYRMEDYYLWVRMLQKGYTGYNIPKPILWMRTGPELYQRRAGIEYAKSQKLLFEYMMDSGFISRGQYIVSVAVRTAAALLPNGIRRYGYRVLMRHNGGGKTDCGVPSKEETGCSSAC